MTAPIILGDMGSLLFGGRVVTSTNGDTFHGDHGYAQYFIPAPSRDLPLVLWHGLGQSGRCWETTPDGRDGFWQTFVRREWPVYILDQPRRGRAGRAIVDRNEVDVTMPSLDLESAMWSTSRLGNWSPPQKPALFPGVKFPDDPAAVEQFLRQQTPSTGPEPYPDRAHRELQAAAVSDLVRRVDECVLVTHSHSGQYGWVTAMKEPSRVRAIISLEPGEFAFPDDAAPEDIPSEYELLNKFMIPQLVPPAEFDRLTEMPILILVGDNIASEASNEFGPEVWRIARTRTWQFVEEVNRRGGNAVCLELPTIGITGNTHFLMSDLNSVEIADQMERFLCNHGLDSRDRPHRGPRSSKIGGEYS